MSNNSQKYQAWIATFDLKTLKETLKLESERTTCVGPQDGVQYTDMEVVQRIQDLAIVIAQKEKDEADRTATTQASQPATADTATRSNATTAK